MQHCNNASGYLDGVDWSYIPYQQDDLKISQAFENSRKHPAFPRTQD